MSLSYSNVGTLLDRTTRCLKGRFQQAFRELNVDITPEQWVLLDHLKNSGAASQTELANGTFKDAPTVSRIIDKLAAKGLAKRTRFPNDRRRYQVKLTSKGDEVYNLLIPQVQEVRGEIWQGLDEEEYKKLVVILEKIRNNTGE